MGRNSIVAVLSLTTALMAARYAVAGQAPAAASDPDIPISHQDRVYSAEQYSNTVSVTDPVDNKLLGAIHLGTPLPANLSPLYKGQLLVHGMGFSPDRDRASRLRSPSMLAPVRCLAATPGPGLLF
jgi:hypothetical protein